MYLHKSKLMTVSEESQQRITEGHEPDCEITLEIGYNDDGLETNTINREYYLIEDDLFVKDDTIYGFIDTGYKTGEDAVVEALERFIENEEHSVGGDILVKGELNMLPVEIERQNP